MKPEEPNIDNIYLEDVETLPGSIGEVESTSNHERNMAPIFTIKYVKQEPVLSPIPSIHERRPTSVRINIPDRPRRFIAWEEDSSSNTNNSNQRIVDLDLDEQRMENEGNLISRQRDLENIVSNMPIHVNWEKGVFYTTGTIVASVLCILPYSSIFPLHNHILQPEYWYETIYTAYIFGGFLLSTVLICIIDNVLNVNHSNKFKRVILVFLAIWIVRSSVKATIYFVWTVLLHYPFPMPFMGLLVMIISNGIALLAIWFRFPSSWRENPMFLSRFGKFVWATLYFLLTTSIYNVMGRLPLKFRLTYQPVIACVLPAMIKLNVNIVNKLVSPASNGDLMRTNIVATFLTKTHYTVYITVILGSITTFATGCTLMMIKLTMDTLICLQIIWTKRKNPDDKNETIRLLQKLVLNEIIEFIVPLAFMLSFLVAFNGKNASLMGGIGSSMWQYNKVDDITDALKKMMIFFVTDLTSVVVCSTLLWFVCKINFFKAVFLLLNEFGMVFCILVGFHVSSVSLTV